LITAVVDREAGVYRCYLNGALWSSDAVTPISRPAITATAPLYIGARGFVPDKYCAGTIDDVRYYNRAPSANEVKALYNAGR
jgi:Concanavalin A-like lectin/glucanases superfamily